MRSSSLTKLAFFAALSLILPLVEAAVDMCVIQPNLIVHARGYCLGANLKLQIYRNA